MKSSKDLRDLIVIFIIISLILILASIFDVVEWFRELATNHDKFDIIELLSVLAFLSILMAVFAFRRWNEIKKELLIKEQSEKDLKDSEKRLLSTVDLSPDTIIIHRNHVIVFMNRAGVYLFGVDSINDMLGKKITDFIHPGNIDIIKDRIERMEKGFQKLPNIEIMIKRADDIYVDVEIASTPVTYHDFPHVITIFRDISERKNNELQLKESEERLQSILDNSAAVVFLKDMNGYYLLVNKQFEKLFNIKRENVKWKNDFDLFPEEIAEQFTQNDKLVLSSQQSLTLEETAPSDGELHTYLTVKFPLYNSYGSPYALCGIATNITDRIRAEETRSRLASIVESSDDAIISYDLEGIILTWNPGAQKVYGYSAAEMIGKHVKSIVPEDKQNEIEYLLNKIRSGNKVDHFETIRITKDDKIIDVSITASPIKDDRNNVTAASVISRDITYKKSVENEMRKYAEELALFNEELYVFSYAASHDLQDPLNNIQLFITELRDKYYNNLDAGFKEKLAFAEDGTLRMSRLITDFLTYSRINADTTKFEDTDFNKVVENARENLKTAIDETHARIIVKDLPVIFCNSFQFIQVFQNLIGNAIKYKSEKRPVIKITSEVKNGEYLFKIKDNGIGIEQWFYERIFILFQKMHDPKKYPGSGIGLALCKRIVEKHGGKIWFDSEPGKGTIFYFTVPKGRRI